MARIQSSEIILATILLLLLGGAVACEIEQVVQQLKAHRFDFQAPLTTLTGVLGLYTEPQIASFIIYPFTTQATSCP